MPKCHFSLKLGFGSIAALLACATLAAQSPMPGGTPQQNPTEPPSQRPSMNQPVEPSMTGTANGSKFPLPGAADQMFVRDAIEGNLAEVQLAQLAEQKSDSSDVKELAQKVQSGDAEMNQKWLKPEAKALQVSVPREPSKKEKKLYDKLEGLSGSQFDRAYMTAMVKDRQDALRRYKRESQTAQDLKVKQIAQMGSQVIAQHLELAEQVAKNHNIPVENAEISSR